MPTASGLRTLRRLVLGADSEWVQQCVDLGAHAGTVVDVEFHMMASAVVKLRRLVHRRSRGLQRLELLGFERDFPGSGSGTGSGSATDTASDADREREGEDHRGIGHGYGSGAASGWSEYHSNQ